MREIRKIDKSIFDVAEYSEDSPTGLVYKKDIKAGYEHRATCRAKGDVAGGLSFNSRSYSMFRGYPCHRIVWEINNGEIPNGAIIDHIDGDRRNNKISNLRLSTIKLNAQNQKMYSTNTSGVTGVYFNKHPEPYGRWTAVWKEDGRILQKSFCVTKYGDEDAFQMACSYRKDKIKYLNKECGCLYTDRHGKEEL